MSSSLARKFVVRNRVIASVKSTNPPFAAVAKIPSVPTTVS
jgi:hypothetical protein